MWICPGNFPSQVPDISFWNLEILQIYRLLEPWSIFVRLWDEQSNLPVLIIRRTRPLRPWMGRYIYPSYPDILSYRCHILLYRSTYPTFSFYMSRYRQNCAFDECPDGTCPVMRCFRVFWRVPVRFGLNMIFQQCYNPGRLPFDSHFLRWTGQIDCKPPSPFHDIRAGRRYTNQHLTWLS